MAKKPRDMTGTVKCLDCPATAVHERGPGTPLVLRHDADCPNHVSRHICKVDDE